MIKKSLRSVVLLIPEGTVEVFRIVERWGKGQNREMQDVFLKLEGGIQWEVH